MILSNTFSRLLAHTNGIFERIRSILLCEKLRGFIKILKFKSSAFYAENISMWSKNKISEENTKIAYYDNNNIIQKTTKMLCIFKWLFLLYVRTEHAFSAMLYCY